MADPIVVDFEGFANKRPVLAGVLVEGAFKQFAFVDVEPGIETAAHARGVRCTTLPAFCRWLVWRARREGRAIGGFSSHERHMIASVLGGWPAGLVYRDVLKVAKAWRRASHPAEEQRLRRKRARMRDRQVFGAGSYGNGLVDFMRLRGVRIPANYGLRRTTARLGRVLGQCARHGSFEQVTPRTKAAWTSVLAHNHCDCIWAARLLEPHVDTPPSHCRTWASTSVPSFRRRAAHPAKLPAAAECCWRPETHAIS